MPKTKRKNVPRRFRNLRDDATVESAVRTIARDYGLPEESVVLVLPSGRKARSDKAIGALRRDWSD